MPAMADTISISDFLGADGVERWRVLSDGACAFYPTSDFAESTRFVEALGGIEGIGAHPPRVDVRHDGVTVWFITKRAEGYGLSRADLELARAVDRLATAHGLTADPSGVQSLLVIPGGPDTSTILPFWRAILGYEPRIDSPEEDLVDPHDRDAALWLEQMDEPRGDGKGAIHVAVWVPEEQARARVEAAVAAGGRVVYDEQAPSWVTLEDPAGNQADVATIARPD